MSAWSSVLGNIWRGGREGGREEREGGKGEREEDIFKSSTRGMSQKPHTKPKPQMITTSSSFLAR